MDKKAATSIWEDYEFTLGPMGKEVPKKSGPAVMSVLLGENKMPVMAVAQIQGAPVVSCLDGSSSITLVLERLFKAASKGEEMELTKWTGMVKDAQQKQPRKLFLVVERKGGGHTIPRARKYQGT